MLEIWGNGRKYEKVVPLENGIGWYPRINHLEVMTAHLQFKFMYLKEIFSVTLISLQKVRDTLLQARKDTAGCFARHSRWRHRGTRNSGCLHRSAWILGLETLSWGMEVTEDMKGSQKMFYSPFFPLLTYYESLKYNPYATFSVVCLMTLQAQVIFSLLV